MAFSCNGQKSMCLKLSLVLAFAIVYVALYKQTKHIIFDITPQDEANRTVVTGSMKNTSGLLNHTFTFAPLHVPSITRPLSMNHTAFLIQNNHTYVAVTSPKVTGIQTVHSMNLALKLYEKRKAGNPQSFFQDEVVNVHNFTYIIMPNNSCLQGNVEIVICVPITGDNFDGRRAIRTTWGSYAYNIHHNALLVFFIGISSDDVSYSRTQLRIEEESATFGDILQENYIDSYQNLSLKSVSILKWASHFCPSAHFILKADDDMYINVPLLVNTLRVRTSFQVTPSAFIIGSMQTNAAVNRNPSSKWYTPVSAFKENVYPKYMSGTAYVMTSQAAFQLYEASLRVSLFWLEDIYITGLCARKASVALFNSDMFSYDKRSPTGCSFKTAISGHRYSLQQIFSIHKELYDPNFKCDLMSSQ